MTPATTTPLTAVERQRRHRDRRRRGVVHIVMIEIYERSIEALIKAWMLSRILAANRSVVADTVEDVFDIWVRAWAGRSIPDPLGR